ncbi:MAG: sensor histidine kinase [Parvibaculales bacterium]
MPTGLYSRSLLIIITPVVVVQIVAGFVFLERHWNSVTLKLSHALVGDLSMLVDMRMRYAATDENELVRLADENYQVSIAFLPGETLPEQLPTPFFRLLDTSLSNEIIRQIDRPHWIDTVSQENYVDIRIQLPGEVFRALVLREKVYATNSHIFIVWMSGTSLLLLTVSIIFLRNQIRPIENLAEAAEKFGVGQQVTDFKPVGASEVRRAASAFMNMRDRIQAHIEQRTTMLAGVSHDLRTPLTRLKLQLAMLKRTPEVEELESDVAEMENMLEDYLSFAKGYQGERVSQINLKPFLEEIASGAKLRKPEVRLYLVAPDHLHILVKPRAFKRCVTNLVNNACNHASEVTVTVQQEEGNIVISVSDNGPGIPEENREDVFRPFFRLDDARNMQMGGTGLGLAIARDIARGHGGDIRLSESVERGLRADITLPLQVLR